MRDLLIAYHRLIKRPGSTLAIVLLLAMTIAGTGCVFAVAYGLLYKSLGYPAEQHLAILTSRLTKIGASGWSVPYRETIARQTHTLDAIVAYRLKDVLLSDAKDRSAGAAEAIMMQPALFGLLGTRPALGRLLVAADATTDAPPSVVIGYELWRSYYGGSRSVLKRSLRIDGRDYRVVGVLPEGSGFPQHDRQVWLPLVFTEDERSVSNAFSFSTELGAVGRLQPGQSMSDAGDEMMRLARNDPALQRLAETVGLELRAQPLRYLWVASRSHLKLMLLAVLAVLLVTAAAVCNLYIMRAHKHRQGLALLEAPSANFAGRVRRMLCEVALLCALGGAIGAVLIPLGLLLLRHFGILPTDMPQTIGGDLATAIFVLAIVAAMAAAMALSGLGLQRPDVYQMSRQAGGGQASSHGARRLREVLVMGQIMLTLILLSATVVSGIDSDRLLNQDLGFERTGLLVGKLQPLQRPQADDLPRQREMIAAWVATVSSMPGVDAVGLATSTPFSDNTFVQPFSPPSTTSLNPRSWPRAYTTFVSAQHFQALGLPIVSGRAFEQEEARAGAPLAIIDADIARKYFGDANPIGKTLSVLDYATRPPVKLTVVGVVAVARQRTLQSKDEFPSLYRPGAVPYRIHGNIPLDKVDVLVRTRSAPAALVDALQDRVAAVAPELRLVQAIPMDQRIADTVKDRRRLDTLLRILGSIATLLVIVSFHALPAYTMRVWFSEFGWSQALADDSRDPEKKKLAEGAFLIAIAVAIVIGWPLSFLLGPILYDQLSADGGSGPLLWVVVLTLFFLFHLIRLTAYLWLAHRASKSKPIDSSRRDD